MPLPTDFTAAACAFVAFAPATGFSSASWAAVPCWGKEPFRPSGPDGAVAELPGAVDDVTSLQAG